MADGALDLRVVSPVETVFEGRVSSVVMPAWDGEVGILPGHAPFISLLGAGTLRATKIDGQLEEIFLRHGVVKVDNDRVTVLSEYAAEAAPEDFTLGQGWLDPDQFLEAASSPGSFLV